MWCVLANLRHLKIYLALCPVSLWSEVCCKTRWNLSMNWKELVFKRCLALKLCSLSTVSFSLTHCGRPCPLRCGLVPLRLGAQAYSLLSFSRPESRVLDLPNFVVRKPDSIDLTRSPLTKCLWGLW